MLVSGDEGTLRSLEEFFSYETPGCKYTRAYKYGGWDGKTRLFSRKDGVLYAGLSDHLRVYCEDRAISLTLEGFEDLPEVSDEEIADAVSRMPLQHRPRDFQLQTFSRCVRKKRALAVQPTASGKTLVASMLIWYFLVIKKEVKKVLFVVPRLTLIDQTVKALMANGFPKNAVHAISGGEEKNTRAPIVVSTWQSIRDLSQEWFDNFDMVIGDEAHGFTAKSLISIMLRLRNCPVRIGLTGTLDDSEISRLVLEGLFGRAFQTVTSRELMDSGFTTPLKIVVVLLSYTDEERRAAKKMTYDEEVEFLNSHPRRNSLVAKIAASREDQNSIVFFNFVEKHGKVMLPLLEKIGRPTYFISGEISREEREEIREKLASESGAILLASEGTFSEGVDIPSVATMIFTSTSKKKVRVLQSIGRGLRLHPGKKRVILLDVADDLSVPGRKNYALRHLEERVKIYAREGFDYEFKRVDV